MALFYSASRRDSISPSNYTFIRQVRVFSCEVSLVYRLKYQCSWFSPYFCLQVIILWIILLSVLFLVSVIFLSLWRCSWCNDYCRRKWTRRHEFKSWTRLIAFPIALIPLGKVWILSFSLQLWINSRSDCFLQPWWGNYFRRRKTLNSNLLNSA